MDQISILEDQAHHFFLLDFDDLPAGGSSKVGERDRKLTRVGGRPSTRARSISLSVWEGSKPARGSALSNHWYRF